MYRTLNDAAVAQNLPSLAEGDTKIWYVTERWHRTFGFMDALDSGCRATTDSVRMVTHVLVGSIKSTDKDEIFHDMQGEIWSPEGEARGLIGRIGASHTSMSIGDVIEIDNRMYMVESFGFRDINITE